jgi:hypothetical protein
MSGGARFRVAPPGLLEVHWVLGEGTPLHLFANLGDAPCERVSLPEGRILYASSDRRGDALTGSSLPPWAVVWILGGAGG